MTKSTTKTRASVKVKPEHHRLLKDRRAATGIKLEALVEGIDYPNFKAALYPDQLSNIELYHDGWAVMRGLEG
jgi:hypothetical protein